MGGPPGDARHDEERGEEFDVESEDVVRGPCWEVQVGHDVDGRVLVHGFGHDVVHVHPLRGVLLWVFGGEFLEGGFHGGYTGVAFLVHAVAEAHDEFFVLELV